MTEQERIEFRQKLRRWRRIITLAILGVFGAIFYFKKFQEQQARRADLKTFRAEKSRLVNSASPYDYYEFQSVTPVSGQPFPDHAHPMAKVLRSDDERVWVLFNVDKGKVDFDGRDFAALFSNKSAGFDTLVFTKKDLLRAVERDSLTVFFHQSPIRIVELLKIERVKGPKLTISSHSQSRLGMRNDGLKGTILSIENIRGTAELAQPLPLEIDDQALQFNIKKDGQDLEFLIKGRSEISGNWAQRVIFKGSDSQVLVE